MPNPQLPIDEHMLNKPPHRYRVGLLTKIIFLLFFILSIVFYFYLLIDRKQSQRKNLIQNKFAAITRSPKNISNIKIFDIKNNKHTNLENYFSGWVLLNLWATWCPPCHEEMPSLDFLQNKLKNKIKIITVSVDQDLEAVKKYTQTNNPSFLVLWDSQKQTQNFFKTNKYPESFLIDPEGKLRAQISGPRDWVSKTALEYFENILK